PAESHVEGRAAGALGPEPGERLQAAEARLLGPLVEGRGREGAGAAGQTKRPSGVRAGEEREARARQGAVLRVEVGPCAGGEQESRTEGDLVLGEEARRGERIVEARLLPKVVTILRERRPRNPGVGPAGPGDRR